MEYTTNYQLKKPSSDDYYDIADFNSNADVIDSKLATGANAYALANQLLTRVSRLETDNSKLKAKTKILLDVYAMPDTVVTITKSGYAGHQFTVGASGYAQREMGGVGVWNISYTYNSLSYSTTVNIPYPGITVVALAPKLEDCTWEFIDKVGSLGLAESCWSVGETKSVTVGEEAMQARILGFNHDLLWNYTVGGNKRAAITFGMTDTLSETTQVHSSQEENVDWRDRDIFTTYLPARKAELSADLQSVIKRVGKVVMKLFHGETGQDGKTASVGGELLETDLFLFSERELFGATRESNPFYEYEQAYEYFARGNSFTASQAYWLRCCGYESYDAFKYSLYMSTGGIVYSGEMTRKYGVLFGFCV